tara:strand:+ start:2286 stop:3482 length:1197 start_codon:yes stop_codon:yes gene_type:complete
MVTLDTIHQKKIKTIKEENSELESYKRKLRILEENKKKLQSNSLCNSSGEIMKLSQEIDELKEKLSTISSNSNLKKYYLNAGDILFKYYEGIENVNKKDKINNKKSQVTKGTILEYLDIDKNIKKEDDNEILDSNKEKSDSDLLFEESYSREDLQQQYLNIVNIDDNINVKVKKKVIKLKLSPNVCEHCQQELSHIHNEGIVECPNCGILTNIINDTDRSSYKDPPKESCYYSYRRSNHFNEWLNQFQGKETTQIPRQVLVQVVNEIKKERIKDLNELSPQKVRAILKKLKLNKYYEHIPYVINQLNGKPPPYMSRKTEEILRLMFQKIQGPFLKFCPKNRKNFLSYSYVLHKFVELLGLDHLTPLFPLLKSREKLHSQDVIWKKICEEIGWEFNKSI